MLKILDAKVNWKYETITTILYSNPSLAALNEVKEQVAMVWTNPTRKQVCFDYSIDILFFQLHPG